MKNIELWNSVYGINEQDAGLRMTSEASLLTLLPTGARSIFSVFSAAHATEHRAWHMVHSQQVFAE